MAPMEEIFITNISIGSVRNIKNLEIALSENERKHLIITGKNGSGKTSLLEAMRACIFLEVQEPASSPLVRHEFPSPSYKKLGLSIEYSVPIYRTNIIREVMFAYIAATRRLDLDIPKSIEKIELKYQTHITARMYPEFLKYILYLNYQLLAAQNDDDKQRLENWFSNFKQALKDIFNCPELELRHDAKELTFKIVMPGYEPFGLNEMADGYSAFLNIVIDLLMRMDDGNAIVNYGQSAIVLVDEIETHLHVELQKKVLPFLTRLFPNVQFIVSTHSPFVITSLKNAVVFDLEKRERLDNPTAYSYETIVEAYFDTDMYSEKMNATFERYKELCFKERSQEETEEFLKVKAELKLVPPAAKELYHAFRECEEKRKAAVNGKNR